MQFLTPVSATSHSQALVDAGALLDVRDSNRDTPLHTACQFGSYDVAKVDTQPDHLNQPRLLSC